MQKSHLLLSIVLLTFSLCAQESPSESEKLAALNQRILDVFKGTEFDIDEAPVQTSSPENIHPTSETNHQEQITCPFKLENPESIRNSIDQFMFKELLDSCSQTLLNEIHNTIYLDTHPTAKNISYRDRFTKLLLVGPQGSGKSSLSLAIAAALNRPYVFVSAASLANEYKNSAITIINNLFDPLIESGIAAVVILDEITAFTKRFTNKNDSDPGAVEHLWVKLDACKQNPNILVIFTANSTDTIPDTIKDRLSACEFHINHPDTNARKRILQHYLSEHGFFRDSFFDTLAAKTKGFSLRELNMLISRAKNKALNKSIRTGYVPSFLDLKKSDVENALKALKTAHDAEVTRKNKEYYKEIFSAVSPHIIPCISMLISTYLQIKFHNEQMEFTKYAHDQSMQHQRLVHWDTMAHAIDNAERQQTFAEWSHEKTMQHQRRVHWDTMAHMIENAERQHDYTVQSTEKTQVTQEEQFKKTLQKSDDHFKKTQEMNQEHHEDAQKQSCYQHLAAPAAGIATLLTGQPWVGVGTYYAVSRFGRKVDNKIGEVICGK